MNVPHKSNKSPIVNSGIKVSTNMSAQATEQNDGTIGSMAALGKLESLTHPVSRQYSSIHADNVGTSLTGSLVGVGAWKGAHE